MQERKGTAADMSRAFVFLSAKMKALFGSALVDLHDRVPCTAMSCSSRASVG